MSYLEDLGQNVSTYFATKQIREMTPPVFFHEQAIALCQKEFLSDRHLQAIYATLVAWGMHRAGAKGAKMPAFNIFKESILINKTCIEKLRPYDIAKISKEELESILPCLTCLCFNIRATTCNSKIVSSSKTLAHILPNLVCPIDNRYTLTFFQEIRGLNEQEKFKFIIKQMWEFFHKINKSQFVLNSVFAHSFPKIFDNLIIEYVHKNNLLNNSSNKQKSQQL